MMRGGVFHEHMISVLEQSCQSQGYQTRRQVPSRPGRKTGYIDLLVENDHDSRLLAIEVEMDKRRVLNDVQKREDLGENAILWIVTPEQKLAQTIRKQLRSSGIEENELICVFTFAAAIQRIMNKDPFCFQA